MHNLVLDSLAMRDAKKVYVSVLASDDQWYHVIGVGTYGEECGRACNNAPLGVPFPSLRWFVSEVLRARTGVVHNGKTFRICDFATMSPLMEFSSLEAMSDYFGVKVER